jgi:uncharacterized protein
MTIRADPTLIGTVRDVRGPTVGVQLTRESEAGLTFVDGRGYRVGQVGSFVKVPIGFVDLFGVVSQVGASAIPEAIAEQESRSSLWITVQLVGEARRGARFERGLGQYPTFGDPVHFVTEGDLARLYGRRVEPGRSIRIGSVASAQSIAAEIGVNPLVSRHAAIVGSTGAGKSTTVATLLDVLSERRVFPSARILVFDVHGEYARAATERVRVLRVSADEDERDTLVMPYWALNFDELLAPTFGPLDGAERAAVLHEVVARQRRSLELQPRVGVDPETLTVDAPVPFSVHDLWFDLYRDINATHTTSGGQSRETEALALDEDGNPIQPGDARKVIPPQYRPHTQASGAEKIYLSQGGPNLRRQVDALGVRLRDRRFGFLFEPGPWTPELDGRVERDLDELLESWLGADEAVTVVDLSGIPPEVLHDVIGIMLRIVYDALFWGRNLAEGGRERPLLVVLEEAHGYLGRGVDSFAAASVRRIVKEGRKYGVGAVIVSQRPSEVDHTVLSQCGTIFALRLTNSDDRAQVVSAVSDNLEGLVSMLPVLRTGEAIVIGEAVNLPMRVLVEPPPRERRPDSADPAVYEEAGHEKAGPGGWNKRRAPEDYAELVELWRSQRSRSPRIRP